MYKNSLGELVLFPIKDEDGFLFQNNKILMNGKLRKTDYIKIWVKQYQENSGKHLLSDASEPKCQIKVREEKVAIPLTQAYLSIDELYHLASEQYKNYFYFGKLLS